MIRIFRARFDIALTHSLLALKSYIPILFTKRILSRESNHKLALLKYISYKSYASSRIIHANQLETLCIARALDRLGYNVDIIPYTSSAALLTRVRRYDLVFGINVPFCKAPIVINYFTGSSAEHQRKMTLSRLADFRVAHQIKLFNERYLYKTNKSLPGILLGNQTTKSTYSGIAMLQYVNAVTPQTHSCNDLSTPNFEEESLFNFLWIGSNALALKGLDTCLSVFSTLGSQYQLHVLCVHNDLFWMAEQDAFNKTNIHYHGFVNSNSNTFAQICRNCQWVLGTSLSEGQSTSILAAMSFGCIPIMTDNCGIDHLISDLRLRQLDGPTLLDKLTYIKTLDKHQVESLSKASFLRSHNAHSEERYTQAITKAVSDICS